ncbi:MAG: helicase, partial [Candidatus Izemoplasmatales bacterium]
MIVEDIILVDNVICDNIKQKDLLEVGLLSNNILSQLRNLVEFISIKIYEKYLGQKLENNEANNKKALEYIKTRGDIRFLSKFHHFLQISRSHYITDYDNAERLMLKYLDYLLKLREYCKLEFDLSILHNLEDFPIREDETYREYYEQISKSIENVKKNKNIQRRNDRFYV